MKTPSLPESLALAGVGLVNELIEGMLDAVWLVNACSLRVVAANAAAGEMLGVDAGTLIGREIVDLCAAPEDLCFWREAAAGVTQGIESETWLRRAEGSLVPVTRRVSRLAAGGDPSFFIVVLHDRSEQRRIEAALEEHAAELAATLESAADGILVTDLAGNVRSFNRAFATLWELPASLVRRRDDDALLAFMRRSVGDPALYMRRLAAIDAELVESADTVALASGKVLQRLTLPLVSRGRTIGRVTSYRDITQRLEAVHRIDRASFEARLAAPEGCATSSDRPG